MAVIEQLYKMTNNKPPVFLLVFSTILFVVSFVCTQIFVAKDVADYDNPIYQFIGMLPPIWTWVLVVVLQPIIEELGFRGWLLKKKIYKVLAIIVIFSFLLLSNVPIWLALCLELLLYFLLFFQPSYRKKLALVTLTSIIFGLLHINNYNNALAQFLVMLQIASMGLILCFITWRFHIVYAILLHIINNFFAVFFIMEGRTQEITIGEFKITIETKLHPFNASKPINEPNHIRFLGNEASFVYWFLEHHHYDSSFVYTNYLEPYTPFVKVDISDTSKMNQLNNPMLLDALLSTFDLKLDTFLLSIYELKHQATDTIWLTEKRTYSKKLSCFNLSTLKASISNEHQIIKESSEDNNIIVVAESLLIGQNNIDLIAEELHNYGISIIKDTINEQKGIRVLRSNKS